MKYSIDQNKYEYEKLLLQVKDCFATLGEEYVQSYKYSRTAQKAIFAFSIVKVLLKNKNLFFFINHDCHKNLLKVVKSYKTQVIDILTQPTFPVEMIMIFQSHLEQLLSYLKIVSPTIAEPITTIYNKYELKLLKEYTISFVSQCSKLFTERIENQESLDTLHASAIVFKTCNLSLKQQYKLLDKLLLIKELWQFETSVFLKKESIPLLFYNNINLVLKKENLKDIESVFSRIIKFFIDENHSLRSLNNNKLIRLYNRIKHLADQSPIIFSLLSCLYRESQFRHAYNRLDDAAYELLKIFESYNTIKHQIEHIEFAIVESFVLKKNTFIHEILVSISKHIENIKVLAIEKNNDLSLSILQIKQNFSNNIQNSRTNILRVNAIESKLATPLEAYIVKRYFALDVFTIKSLKKDYENLFKNILALFNKKDGYKEFVQRTISCKIAQDYKIENVGNSRKKLRTVEQERLEVIKRLSEINFLEIFHPRHLNKISTLSFRKYIRKININSPLEYVAIIIKILIKNLNVSQLESISQSLIDGNLPKNSDLIKQELLNRLKRSTTLFKMIYYIFTGKKNELLKLNSVKESLENINNKNH